MCDGSSSARIVSKWMAPSKPWPKTLRAAPRSSVKNILFKRDPFHRVAGLFGEFVGETLHADHVTVVHSGDCERLGVRAGDASNEERTRNVE